MCVYHLVWTAVLVVCLVPAFLFRNERLLARLSVRLPPRGAGGGTLWVHALSVGEVISAIPLVRKLASDLPDYPVVVTVTTAKGMEIARKELEGQVSGLFTMPIDAWWCMRRMVGRIDPRAFVLVETDIWPGLIGRLRGLGVPRILVNGRVSPRTFRSYRRFPAAARMLFRDLDTCLVQSDLDRSRLLGVGVSPGKVITTGNIKFDREWTPMSAGERDTWVELFRLEPGEPVWVAGSTHEGEDEIVLRVFKELRVPFPTLRLIIAPRNVGKAPELIDRARAMGLAASLRSSPAAGRKVGEAVVLDTMGELGRMYGLATVSFVGGSLVPVGGHNLLEPASFGCPVVFGPHMHNFVLMSETLVESGGGRQVEGSEELLRALKELLEDHALRSRMGRSALEFVMANRGALDKVVSCVCRGVDGAGGER